MNIENPNDNPEKSMGPQYILRILMRALMQPRLNNHENKHIVALYAQNQGKRIKKGLSTLNGPSIGELSLDTKLEDDGYEEPNTSRYNRTYQASLRQ